MPFVTMMHTPGRQTRWAEVTHIRLVPGRHADTDFAQLREAELRRLADADNLVLLSEALRALEPVRNLKSGREASIKSDLRNWSNPRVHGNNSLDKGWLELGYLTE